MKASQDTSSIFEAITRKKTFANYQSSVYFFKDGVNYRISNHLPKDYNLKDNHDIENEKFMFVFTSDIKEKEWQIKEYLENIFDNGNFDFYLLDDAENISQSDIEYINHVASRI